MRTPAQIAASKTNGAKSKGPVTPQGKRNSSKNAVKHGLLAANVVLETENKELFFEWLNELMEEHQPATPTEAMLVRTIASAQWRRDRIWSLQKHQFDNDIAAHPAAPPPDAALQSLQNPDVIRTHELLLRYEVALDREISRALVRLTHLQSRRQERQQPEQLPTPVVGQVANLRPIANRPIKETPPSISLPQSTHSLPPAEVGQVSNLRPISNRATKKTPTTKQPQHPAENKRPTQTQTSGSPAPTPISPAKNL